MDPHTACKRQPKPVPLAARAPPKHLRLSVDSAASTSPTSHSSRYESQKHRDWNSFLQYLKIYKPSPLTLAHCKGSHVLEYLKYLDQFGKTKVHAHGCAYFGHPNPPARCPCPLRQAWGSLDSLIGRLRAAYGETGGQASSNPFAATAVRVYLREVRDSQAKARGIVQVKKKRKRKPAIVSPIPLSSPPPQPQRKKSVDDCRRTLPSPEYS